MKGVPHFSICQQFWNEKLPWSIYLHIGQLTTTTKMNEKSKQKHKWEQQMIVSNSCFKSRWWLFWNNKFWYVDFTFKIFVPKLWHPKTIKRRWQIHLQSPCSNSKPQNNVACDQIDETIRSKNFWTHPKVATNNQSS